MNPQNYVKDQIEARLKAAFAVTALRVEDESEQHRGHAGWREGGQTHFHVALSAPELAPLGRVARHRAVHAALGAQLLTEIHALRLTLS